jgi:hypothetical protein
MADQQQPHNAQSKSSSVVASGPGKGGGESNHVHVVVLARVLVHVELMALEDFARLMADEAAVQSVIGDEEVALTQLRESVDDNTWKITKRQENDDND